ncbi:Nuclear pore complex protein Nup133 like protein [Argiope bruennichi]|uniref:Nuclear pore complex protein Nup133 like protein n=1 Tax=Argiope bruennichi TaxID=94029 RepID=A0A8T0FX68_ARGBR|nr:Nuclear pore complex protein Nup133 like protein [Argiope bruennichi]
MKSSPYISPFLRRSLNSNVSRNSSFGQSFMNSHLEDPSNHLFECYGSTLPVLVTEAITVADRISDISVKLEPFGYASLVCGRQLLIWKYKQDGEKSVVHCKELTLPPSDLAHKAELVHLFQTEESRLPSALAVSPEGHVRYWPNINHEGSSVDAQPHLQGQECCSLSSIYPLGCVLATTSSSLIIITPTIGDGQPNVICRTLTLPQGVLAGIGRKVSSFIFGVIPSQTSETKQLNRVLSTPAVDGDYFLYVLSNSCVQKWHIAKDRKENYDQLLFEIDLDRELKQSYVEELFSNDSSIISNLATWCLDMQLYQSGVMILTAGTVPVNSGGNVHYAFGYLDTSSSEQAQSFSSFHLTKYTEIYQEGTEEKLLNYKLLLPSADSPFAYMYNTEKVICISIDSPQSESSEVDFSAAENVVLGSGSCDGMPLFFTRDFGIISFLPNQKQFADSKLLASVKDVSIRKPDPSELPDSLSAKLRFAMCSYCSRKQQEQEKCEKLVNEILDAKSQDVETLDDAVINLSLQIIDDYPASDPRWCESLPTGSFSSSLLISYQLDDKLKVHECLLAFLKTFHLFEKLTSVKLNDFRIHTNVLLCEHAEKLVAAKTIRLFLTEHGDIIEAAVRNTLESRGIEVKNHLTPQDVFFREVSTFHTIFPSLIEWEKEQLDADESLEKTLSCIMAMNKIFVGLLEAINEYRQTRVESYNLKEIPGNYFPWTARDGHSGIRPYIRDQLNVNVNYAMNLTDNIQIQGVLFQQYVEILDFFLNSYQIQLHSVKNERQVTLRKEYEQERHWFIKPLLSVDQYERAAAIAEKYMDFDMLMQICEETKDSDRLQRYMLQFTEQHFSEFVFKWYMNKGQKGRIFDKQLGQRETLGNFLQEHESLKWLFFIQEQKYDAAHSTLKQLALKETQYLSRKKTLLSLSKLCALISDAPPNVKSSQIEAVNLEHDLITHQEALPLTVVESYGIDPRNMRVFSPEELIEMYISDENSTANAYDFKIALDLLNFMKKPLDDPEIYNLRMHIWTKAVLRDSWETLDISNPLEAFKQTIFFQIVELAFDQGIEIHDFLPPIEDLLQTSELSDLADNPSFKFLLQAGYEHILKIIS